MAASSSPAVKASQGLVATAGMIQLVAIVDAIPWYSM